MKLFEDYFPVDSSVSMKVVDGLLCVGVYTARPRPDWLLKNKSNLAGNTKITTDRMKEEMLKLIRLKPGLAESFYTRLAVKHGGVSGSQDRKEETLRELITSGKIVKNVLDKPIGRKTHEIYAV